MKEIKEAIVFMVVTFVLGLLLYLVLPSSKSKTVPEDAAYKEMKRIEKHVDDRRTEPWSERTGY